MEITYSYRVICGVLERGTDAKGRKARFLFD